MGFTTGSLVSSRQDTDDDNLLYICHTDDDSLLYICHTDDDSLLYICQITFNIISLYYDII
ncbi:hypothetical protein T492DRAFT_136294 [Pavlovales sp. CCMP2436]|nr:hypothetical protein T492DRAFT_136294 [Pavlovales sp. CCMP2436]